ncbi:uncharacterized protein MELLADRAFT_92373 [Melampsora larici-populina 98AG31]|uniref:Uncharacterized protein n=1 Tax=Melampsora larici-populina (strain 98AG31 / pathotype 3-4-7) TaxID=747676 RepID=F4R9E0_MELLP|nr:uncharacterized protein MELLADRAFT_92373 [Melampsora larici-populina 98AG31]EGG11172.1 hypothetical protein MELLADRAFT_92373 [Melampsora larici-populina 98AG31]
MSLPPTMTQMTPGVSSGGAKRQRVEEDDYQRQGVEGGSDDEDDESSDGGLTHEESLERKRKRTAKLKALTQIRHREAEIGKVAAQHEVPKAATPLARAIHEYTRMLMGIPRKARGTSMLESVSEPKLPDPPSEEERQAWECRKQLREKFIRDAQDKAMQKYLAKKPTGFKPNRKQRKTVEKDAAEMAAIKKPMQPVIFTSRISAGGRTRYAHHFGTQCEAALAMAGFPRCTFDWQASYDSPWNAATATIILAHWVKTYDANGARAFGIISSDNTPANREEVLRRWCGNKAPKHREQTRHVEMFKTPAGKKLLEDHFAITHSITSKRRNKEKIVEARLHEAFKFWGKSSAEYAMLSHPEVHSEDELQPTNASGSRQRLRLDWRSAELDTLIMLLDQSHWKRKTIPKERRAAKQLVERGNYAPTADPDRFPPKGFQASLISPGWLDNADGLIVSELDLNEEDAVDVQQAIQDAMRVFKSRANLAEEEASGSTLS